MGELFGYKVEFNRNCVSSFYSEDRYDGWSKEFKNNLNSVSKTKEKPDTLSFCDIKSGDNCFAVWAEWNEGDSSGVSKMECCECFWLFSSEQEANDFANELMAHENGGPVLWFLSDGNVIDIKYLPWGGYFDRLQRVNVTPMVIK